MYYICWLNLEEGTRHIGAYDTQREMMSKVIHLLLAGRRITSVEVYL